MITLLKKVYSDWNLDCWYEYAPIKYSHNALKNRLKKTSPTPRYPGRVDFPEQAALGLAEWESHQSSCCFCLGSAFALGIFT